LLKELRLVGGYEVLYGQVKRFVRERLFEGPPVDLGDPVVLRNLSESAAAKSVFDTFKAAINALTVQDSGRSRIEDYIRLRDVRPFRTQAREWLPAKRSIFNRIVGEANAGALELRFAAFLDGAPGVASFAKDYLAIGFRLDYVKADGDLSTYTPTSSSRRRRRCLDHRDKGPRRARTAAQDGAAGAMVRRRDRGEPRCRRADVPLRLRRPGRFRQAPAAQPQGTGNDVPRVPVFRLSGFLGYHFASDLLPTRRSPMSTLVVKNLPDDLHEQLRERAQRNHRSVTKEAIVLLEQGMLASAVRRPVKLPPPIKLKGGPATTEWIETAIAEGRD
jgi:plasmid stability protein